MKGYPYPSCPLSASTLTSRGGGGIRIRIVAPSTTSPVTGRSVGLVVVVAGGASSSLSSDATAFESLGLG